MRQTSTLIVGFLGFAVLAVLVSASRLDAGKGSTFTTAVKFTTPQGLSVKPGAGTPITVHPKNAQIKVEDGGATLVGPGDRLLATFVRREGVEKAACFSFSPDGKYLAVGIAYDSVRGGKDGTIRGYLRLYDCESGRLLWDSGPPVIGPVTRIAFSKEGDTILYRSEAVEFIGGK